MGLVGNNLEFSKLKLCIKINKIKIFSQTKSKNMDDSTMESSRMFWGIVLKPEKRYEQTVQEPFHISKACIEPTTSKGSVTSVFVEVDDADEFIICNLSERIMNENLDLNFNSGDKICFRTAGTGSVHLTGYNILEEDDGPDDFDFSDDGSEESEAEEVPQLVNGKRKTTSAGSDLNPAKKSNKDLSPLDKLLAEKKQASDLRDKLNAKKEESENIEESEEDEESDDEESEDDDDFIAKEAPEGEAEEDDEEDDEGEEEESEDDDADESMETESPTKDIEIKKSPKKEPAGSPKKEPKTPEPAKKKSALSPKKEPKTAEPATPKPSASGDANEKSENNTETQSAKKKKKKNKKNKNKENDAGNANAPNTPAPASQEIKDSQKDEKKTPSKPEKPKVF